MKYEELTDRIIGCFYRVYGVLGFGFLEKVYENALAIEFEKAGLKFGKQAGIQVMYDEKVVGDYVADFIIDGKVVVGRSADPQIAECWGQIKALDSIGSIEKAQVINYLSQRDDLKA